MQQTFLWIVFQNEIFIVCIVIALVIPVCGFESSVAAEQNWKSMLFKVSIIHM